MTVETGHFALIVALILATLQSTVPLFGASRGRDDLMTLARHTAWGQLVCVAIAFSALMNAFATSDFSVTVVAQNSHSAKPFLYKLAATWGHHEGSLLLWILILVLFGVFVASAGRGMPLALRARVLAVQGMVAMGFLLFTLLTSNPFGRLDVPPIDGNSLNPLLQDPGLVIHPPLLYFGYVGLSTAFSFAVAALIEGKVTPDWARWARPWVLIAWSGLTMGIALGSWWAYYELGWGGFWFWDPVENASFMPWLVATALLHSILVVAKRDGFKGWTLFLAIMGFSLSLLGTFIVRSGLLTSVHAFATDPARGVFILGLLAVAIGGAFLLFAIRAPALEGGKGFQPVSREGALMLNNLLLATAAATVLLGTMYPLFLEAMSGEKVSVGPPYFNATFVPLMLPMLMLMAVAPLLSWRQAKLLPVVKRLWLAAVAGIGVAVFAIWAGDAGVGGVIGFGVAAWLGVGTIIGWLARLQGSSPLRRLIGLPMEVHGMTMAHLGAAILVAGMTATSVWQAEAIRLMRPGDSVELAGYNWALKDIGPRLGPNYRTVMAEFIVTDSDGDPVAKLYPERRFYPVAGQNTTEAGIHTLWYADLYAVIGEGNPSDGWAVRLYYNPLVPWMWFGAGVMSFGGLVSATGRLRVRRRAKAAGPQPAGAAA
ncbi:MAG: heme lyase CcmF/NrfE family subunit [Alphaproteobacteria bacterium]|jgi:cytochrome c-type biogenesis protein CcmF